MKAIIWDMDGTITDTEKYWMENPLRLLEHFGVPDPRGKDAPWFQTSSARSINTYLHSPECRLNMTLDECVIWCRNYIYTHIYADGAPLKPHARDSLDAAKALGIPMCLLSATEQQSLHYTLDKLNMGHYFTFWQTTCNRELDKYHVELFQQAASRMGVALQDCLLVEDSLYSMKTGKQGGCTVWAIEDPKHAKDKEAIIALADRYFENHQQLAQALREATVA